MSGVTTSIRLRREDYHVAWICPLEIETLAALLMLEKEHDHPDFDHRAQVADENSYSYGEINGRNIVIASLLGGLTGNVNASKIVAPLKGSFPGLRMVLLVGIGGGVPCDPPTANPLNDIHLGDVVVGWTGDWESPVVYYESGRAKSDEFQLRNGEVRPGDRITSALQIMWLKNRREKIDFKTQIVKLEGYEEFGRPPADSDRLYEPSYAHTSKTYGDCRSCNIGRLVERPPRGYPLSHGLVFHRGIIGSGNSVCQDGTWRNEIRDRIRNGGRGDIRCIEMEAAGVSSHWPCLVIRGISDYADSHKGDLWNGVAAGNAAAFAAELLCRMSRGTTAPGSAGAVSQGHSELGSSIHLRHDTPEHHWVVPFGRNRDFKGRGKILDRLLDIIPPSADKDACQRVVLEGLGGVGKTQIALEAAFRLRERHPACSVFWVPAVDTATFENAYRQIGQKLGVQGLDEDNADVKHLVKAALDREDAGSWHLIIDNADDTKLLFRHARLCDHLPSSRKGSILITTRSRQVAVSLTQPGTRIGVPEMDQDEAIGMLQAYLQDDNLRGTNDDMTSLLEFLCFFPLAIKQAAAYMATKRVSASRYLRHCRESDQKLAKLLSKGFEDQGRYDALQNPVATTWLVSFKHIQQNCPLAAKYLRFVCFLTEKDIPRALLPVADELYKDESDEDELDVDDALGELEAYAFITQREGGDSFDLHRLVRLAMRNWVEGEGQWVEGVKGVIQRLNVVFPFPKHENRDVWMRYLPHAQIALASRQACTDEEATSDLLSNVGESNYILGKHAEAETMHRQALQLRKKVLGDEHPDTVSSMNNLANVLSSQGKHAEAETMHRQALQLSKKVLGDEHPDTVSSMSHVASVLSRQGKHAEAETMHRQALHLNKKVLGDEHPSTVTSMSHVASVLSNQGNHAEAETMHRQALQLRKKVLGDEHPETLNSMNNLALVLYNQGKYAEAETMHRRSPA